MVKRNYSLLILVVLFITSCSTKQPVKKQKTTLVKPSVTIPVYTPNILDQQIAHRLDGYEVVSWSPTYGPNQVWLWTNKNFIETKQLDNSLPYTKPVSLFCGDEYLVANPNGGVGPVEVNEYDSYTFQWVDQFKFGDLNTRIGCGVQLKNGNTFFINFVTFGFNTPTYAFDVALKSSGPPLPNSTSSWQTNRITLPNSDTGAVACQMCCCEMNGLVYVFYGFDGSGRIDSLVFDGINVKYQKVNWIGRQSGDVAPSIEVPLFHAVYDKWSQRILLCYMGVNAKDVGCRDSTGNIRLTYPLTITAVDTNCNYTLVKTLPWNSFQDDFPLHSICPRPNGIYFYTAKQVECNDTWVSGLIDNSGIVTTNSEKGELYSMSSDGWFIYRDFNSFQMVLDRLQFSPIMRIYNIDDGQVKICWDCSELTDSVEGSDDLHFWNHIVWSASPVYLSKNSYHYKYFRIVK